MSQDTEIFLSPFTETDVLDFVSMSKSYYLSGDILNSDIIRHKFLAPPFECFHLTISKQGLVLGRAALAKRNLVAEPLGVSATQVTDLLVDKKHSNIFLISNLVKNYKALGTDIVIHTANEQSQDLYERFFKFNKLFECKAKGFALRLEQPVSKVLRLKNQWLFKPIQIAYRLSLYLGLRILDPLHSMRCREIGAAEFDALVQAGGFQLPPCAMDRGIEYYKWRFFDHPLEYKCLAVQNKSEVVSCFFVRQTEFEELTAFLLMDFLPIRSNGRKTSPFRVILALIKFALGTRSDIIFTLANFNSSFANDHLTYPLFSIPERILPHPTPVFLHKPPRPIDAEVLKTMYFTLADLDYF